MGDGFIKRLADAMASELARLGLPSTYRNRGRVLSTAWAIAEAHPHV